MLLDSSAPMNTLWRLTNSSAILGPEPLDNASIFMTNNLGFPLLGPRIHCSAYRLVGVSQTNRSYPSHLGKCFWNSPISSRQVACGLSSHTGLTPFGQRRSMASTSPLLYLYAKVSINTFDLPVPCSMNKANESRSLPSMNASSWCGKGSISNLKSLVRATFAVGTATCFASACAVSVHR